MFSLSYLGIPSWGRVRVGRPISGRWGAPHGYGTYPEWPVRTCGHGNARAMVPPRFMRHGGMGGGRLEKCHPWGPGLREVRYFEPPQASRELFWRSYRRIPRRARTSTRNGQKPWRFEPASPVLASLPKEHSTETKRAVRKRR